MFEAEDKLNNPNELLPQERAIASVAFGKTPVIFFVFALKSQTALWQMQLLTATLHTLLYDSPHEITAILAPLKTSVGE